MEEIANKWVSTGINLFTDTSLRMPVPPSSSNGTAYEDLGSTQFKQRRLEVILPTSLVKRSTGPARTANVSQEESDDDLDLISNSKRHDDESDPDSPPKKRTRKPPAKSTSTGAGKSRKPRTRARKPEPYPSDMSPTRSKNSESPPQPSAETATRIPPSDDEITTRGGPRPFPMDTTVLKSIGEASPSASMPTAGPSKLPQGKRLPKPKKFPLSTQVLESITSNPSPEPSPLVFIPFPYDRVLMYNATVHNGIPLITMTMKKKILVSTPPLFDRCYPLLMPLGSRYFLIN